MYKTIAIIERSNIIKEGLTYLLKSYNVCSQIAKLNSLNEWPFVFKDEEPDLVIINPDRLKYMTPDKVRLRYEIPEKIPFIGLIYQYVDRDVHGMFDALIYITDTEDIIIGKIQDKQGKDPNAGDKLTEREKSVLKLLLKGLSNKEVADKLVISPHTVITHRKNVVDKTGIRSLSGLAIFAILNNIVDMEDISEF